MFKCPFEKHLKAGTMCCDHMGVALAQGVEQCPTPVFNRCQADGEPEEASTIAEYERFMLSAAWIWGVHTA